MENSLIHTFLKDFSSVQNAKNTRLGFELGPLSPFPATIIVIPRVPPRLDDVWWKWIANDFTVRKVLKTRKKEIARDQELM